MRWLIVILRILLGLVFVFSGWIKLYPIEPFEYNFVHMGVANWTVAPFLARGILSVEILLGLSLIFNPYMKATILGGLGLLCLFTIYLFIAFIVEGNQDNCGCFGTYLQMSTTESIVKNLILTGLLILLWKYGNPWKWKRRWIVFVALMAVSLATPFVLNPVNLSASDKYESVKYPYKAPFDLLPDMEFNGRPTDLTKGKKLIGMFSLKCHHCRHLATKLSIISEQADLPDVYVIFIGDKELIPRFLKKTGMRFPYKLFNDSKFFKISGPTLPALLYVKNGMVYHFWTGEDVPAEDLYQLASKEK